MSIFAVVSAGKILNKRDARVDNMVFHLHYRITFIFFIISSLLVTAKEFFGQPIMCQAKSSVVSGAALNTYCYIMSTFSLPSEWNTTVIGKNSPYMGLGTGDYDTDRRYHTYYLWVPMVLFLQACLFYFPHVLWKKIETGTFEIVLDHLNVITIDQSGNKKKFDAIIGHLTQFWHDYKKWACGFFLCEALNLVNVVGNIYFTNYFLGGTFLSYGTEVANFPDIDPENRVDPMSRIFPKMAKCTFRKYGASGTLETIDALCLLPINIINEKIYIFLWFWLIFMSALTALWLVYRLCTLASPALRNGLISIRGRCAGKPNLKIITDRCDLGDWFMLYQLGCHMEPTVYGEFLKQFAKELENGLSTMERKPMLKDN